MKQSLSDHFIRVGRKILPVVDIRDIDLDHLEQGTIRINLHSGHSLESRGIEAIDILMQVKPSALEGKRLKWDRNVWAAHNLLIHPAMQILAFCGLKRQAVRLHDATIPRPKGFR